MGHLPDSNLVQFKAGTPLTAAALNANFLTLLALLEGLALEARTPDPVVVELEAREAALEARVKDIERLTAMHARQRNEREWAPLSHLGAVITLVNDLRRDLETGVSKLAGIYAELMRERGDHERRLARLEQQPEPALQEEFAPLQADHERLAQKEHMILAQVIAIRHEMQVVTKLAMGHDRKANRLEFAPLSTIGHILQRLREIEARLP